MFITWWNRVFWREVKIVIGVIECFRFPMIQRFSEIFLENTRTAKRLNFEIVLVELLVSSN